MRRLTAEEVGARLEFDNPWWADDDAQLSRFGDLRVRRFFAPFHAHVTHASVRRAVVLMGPRRVGKTVMFHQSIQALLDSGVDPRSILYCSVDTPTYVGRGLEQLVRLFQERLDQPTDGAAYVFFDEIQYLPQWEVHLKSLVDSFPKLRIVASGSAAAALRMKSRESGAGRFTEFLLPPLTFAEYLDFRGEADASTIERLNELFVEHVNFGGFPEAVMVPEVRADPGRYLRGDVIEKVLLRDLPSLYGIEDVQELFRLFAVLALNTGQEVNVAELSKDSGVQQKTLRRYLEYLQAAFLIWILPRVDGDGARYKRRTNFKVHLANPSMRSALFAPTPAEHDDFGHLAETAIAAEALPGAPRHFSYARWKDGRRWLEVDLVWRTASGDVTSLCEVKWTDRATARPEELRGLVRMARRVGANRVIVTTRTAAEEREIGGVTVMFRPTSWVAARMGTNLLEFRAQTGQFGPLP